MLMLLVFRSCFEFKNLSYFNKILQHFSLKSVLSYVNVSMDVLGSSYVLM